MTLVDLASLGSFLSGVAVALSLVYLALQMHQNAKHTRALIQQGRVGRVVDLGLAMGNPDSAAALVASAGVESTPELVRRLQIRFISAAFLTSFEDTFSQHEEGLLSEDLFGSLRASVANFLALPTFREDWSQWKADRPDTGTRFKAFVDDIAAKSAISLDRHLADTP
jgi:hypothetical protein